MCSNGEPMAGLAAAVDALAGQDLAALPDPALAGQALQLRQLLERAEGEWLRRLAAVDGRGAAGAEDGDAGRHPSTAGWLRARARMAPRTAHERVRVGRALHRGRLPAVAAALAAGEISYEHAAAIVQGLGELPPAVAGAGEEAALGLAREDERAQRQHARRGLDINPTFEGMVALNGLLDPEAGETVRAAITALARPAGPDDERSAAQRRADALTELARRSLDVGDLPESGGARPHIGVVIDWPALLGLAGAPGGEFSWGGLVSRAVARRLACDAALTRIVIRRDRDHADHPDHPDGGHTRVRAILRAALDALPAVLGGPPAEPLDLGRATRTISPAQRRALAIRDGGCRFPGCSTPPMWCDGHHVIHWVDGGRTDLANLVLLCRRHHRAVHDGGWAIHREHTGQFVFTPPARAPTSRVA